MMESETKTRGRTEEWDINQRYTLWPLCHPDEYAFESNHADVHKIWSAIHGDTRTAANLHQDFRYYKYGDRGAEYKRHISKSWTTFDEEQKEGYVAARKDVVDAAATLGITLPTPSNPKEGPSSAAVIPTSSLVATPASADATTLPHPAVPSTTSATTASVDTPLGTAEQTVQPSLQPINPATSAPHDHHSISKKRPAPATEEEDLVASKRQRIAVQTDHQTGSSDSLVMSLADDVTHIAGSSATRQSITYWQSALHGVPYDEPFHTLTEFAAINVAGRIRNNTRQPDARPQSSTPELYFETPPFPFVHLKATGGMTPFIAKSPDKEAAPHPFIYHGAGDLMLPSFNEVYRRDWMSGLRRHDRRMARERAQRKAHGMYGIGEWYGEA